MSQEEGGFMEMQDFLRSEFIIVKKHLDELSRGQAKLTFAMEKTSISLGRLLNKEELLLSKGSEQLFQPHVEGDDGAKHWQHSKDFSLARKEHTELDQPTHSEPEFRYTPSELEFKRSLDDMRRSNKSLYRQQTMRQHLRESTTNEYICRITEIDEKIRTTKKQAAEKWKKASYLQRLVMLEHSVKDLALEAMICGVILANTLFIGISSDHWSGEIDIFCYIDLVFGVVFLTELLLKLCLNGCIEHFTGKDRRSNCFDLICVALDTVQLFLLFFAQEVTQKMQEQGIPAASLFRIVRVLRIARIFRLLRFSIFDDLVKMVEGVVFGEKTLLWAFVLFCGVLYVGAILAKDAFGNVEEATVVSQNFDSVLRSMYTIFRCSFGDCNTANGRSIPAFIYDDHGILASAACCLFEFFVMIGLFNVISAIFVDSTMARAAEKHAHKLVEKFADDNLWCTNVCIILRECLKEHSGEYAEMLKKSNGNIEAPMFLAKFTSELVDSVCVHNEFAKSALERLSIESLDHGKLADILDPDHSGHIEFSELLNGLYRLRGQPRRSDIVSVDLMVRATQEKLDDIHDLLYEKLEELCTTQKDSYFLLLKSTMHVAKRESICPEPEYNTAEIVLKDKL